MTDFGRTGPERGIVIVMRDFYTKENMQGEAFHVPDAGLAFEPSELAFEMETGTGREGVIRVRHKAGKPSRGYVYSSGPCMRAMREQFAPGADGTGFIRWQFDARGIAPGRTVRGFFRVISPFGEYRIPYCAEISGKGELLRKKEPGIRDKDIPEKDPARLEILSKEQFAALAGKDPMKAAGFFYSGRFENILTTEEDRTLYRGLSMKEGNLQNMEEFLIAACGMEKTIYEPAVETLVLQVQGRAGRTEGRMAGTRAERALEAHRQRVRSSGLGGAPAQRKAPAQEDLVYMNLGIRKIGSGFSELQIRAEGRFLPTAPFSVPQTGKKPEQESSADTGIPAEKKSSAEDVSIAAVREAEPSKEQTGLSASQPGSFAGQAGSAAGQAGTSVSQERPSASQAGPFAGQAVSAAETVFTVRIPVNRAALHAGRNFGRILLRGPFNDAEVPVEVHCSSNVSPVRRRQESELRLLQLQLMRLYTDYRLEQQYPGDRGQHPEDRLLQAEKLIEEISIRSHKDLVPRLFVVHLLILRKQYTEAARVLTRIAARYAGQDDAQYFSARFTGEKEGAYCYRQYLFARCHMDDVQLRSRVVRFLHGVYRQNGDWRIAWMLMDLSEEYAPGTSARWNFLRHQFESGCSSPVIWIEAWEMVRQNPQILLPGSSVQERWARDDFGLHVLWYAARNYVLTPEAAEVMITLAEKKKIFSKLLYRGLCAAYEIWDSGEDTEDSPDSGTREESPAAGPESGSLIRTRILRAICILLVRRQDISAQAHKWYTRAIENNVSLTTLEESWRQSVPADDAVYRMPAGRNAVLRTTASRAVRAVLVYDRFRGEQVFPIKDGVAFLPVYGDANTVFLEDAAGNRCAKSLPYALDVKEDMESALQDNGPDITLLSAPSGPAKLTENPYALAQWLGFGSRSGIRLRYGQETMEAAGRLLDSGLLTFAAHTKLILLCLERCGRQSGDAGELVRFFLSRVQPMRCSESERERLLGYLLDAGENEEAVRWLGAFGPDKISSGLLARACTGVLWEGNVQDVVVSSAWEAFVRGNRDSVLLERLAAEFTGLSEELLDLRRACTEAGLPTNDLEQRIIRQILYSGSSGPGAAQVIVSAAGRLGDVFLPAVAQYADYAFSNGLSLGVRMTDLIAGLLLEEGDRPADICRIAYLKELSMRHEEITEREKAAAQASLAALLSREIIFPFYRQFPGYDDRLDLYAEETLVQYHPASPDDGRGRHIVFHYAASRRGEAGNYRARPMKEMYRDFFVSGFVLFYGEQMHYYITDDAAEKNVVQSGTVGQDARIPESCSGRFGLINDTTRAAALREYDEALELLTGYYRRSYLESELFRR